MWSDTDPAGIVWFGVFFRYFEHAEEDLYRRLGSDRTALLRRLSIFMPRTSLHPVSIAGQARRRLVGRRRRRRDAPSARIGFAFDIHERGTGRLICEASYRVACVDAATFTPQPFPREMVALLSPARIDGADVTRDSATPPKRSASRDSSTPRRYFVDRNVDEGRGAQRRDRVRRRSGSPTPRCSAT